MGLARQVQLGVGGSGSILRLPASVGSMEATPVAPDIHPTISADMVPTTRHAVSLMPTAQPTITPQTPQQLAASQTSGALDPSKSRTIWYIIGGLALVLVLVMLAKR